MTANNPHNLAVGQSLYFVPDNRRFSPHEVTIKKIGHRYATTTHEMMVYLTTLRKKTDYDSGTCYLSVAAWETERDAMKAWRALCRSIEFSNKPHGLTEQRIKDVADLLHVKDRFDKEFGPAS